MKEEKDNIHGGHRQRVKQSFLESGFNGFSDINKLEMLLFYSIPRKDTNVIAHNLINEFGSISAVFDASPEMLMKVKGVTPNTATLISMMRELFNTYENSKLDSSKIVLDNAEKISEYCVSKFIGKTDEHLYALLLDNNLSLINCALISSGTPNTSNIHIRKIVEQVVASNATSVIVCHNHPNGVAAPSSDDLYTTKQISDALKYLNVKLIDHVIVAGRDSISLAASKKFNYLFRL
jgi:DNA repair protein RadC